MPFRTFSLLLALVASGASAEELLSETILLARVRSHMQQTLTRLPNYTCLQTTERHTRPAPDKKIKLVDVVRLEVALVEGKELFSWPGAKKFEDKEIGDLVNGGAIGNGTFGLHAHSVFFSSGPRFIYIGETTRPDGRKAIRWNFSVPQMLSGYRLRSNRTLEAIVGYHGSFWIDASTLDLIRLEVHADDIPAFLKITVASNSMQYERVEIGGERFLLPTVSELSLIDSSGSESINRTSFNRCRQYTGESVLSFEDPPEDAKEQPVVLAHLDIPGGIALDIALETPIDVKGSAVGDPVTAVLKKNVNLGGGVVAVKGALLHGRITHLRPQNSNVPGYAIGIKFMELEFASTRGRVRAKLEHIGAAGTQFSTLPFENSPGRFPRQPQAVPAVEGSVFFARGSNIKLERGFRMLWRTEPLELEEKQ